MASATLNYARPLNGAVVLNWTLAATTLLDAPSQVAGFITVLDTLKNSVSEVLLSPDELAPLKSDGTRDITDINYTVRGLSNGTLYIFTLNVYHASIRKYCSKFN